MLHHVRLSLRERSMKSQPELSGGGVAGRSKYDLITKKVQ